jgi:trimeric autotransporter adhesin
LRPAPAIFAGSVQKGSGTRKMLPPIGSSTPKYTIPSLDYNSLAGFYTTGAFMGTAKHADKLASGALKDILSIDPRAPVAPWQLRQPKEGELVDRVFSGKDVIDKTDPLFDRDDIDDNFKNLFALYKGLAKLEEITEFATTAQGNILAPLLQRQYDRYLTEIKDFVNTAEFSGISVVPELKSDTLKSTIAIEPTTDANAYVGKSMATTRTDPVTGLTTADGMTISVTRDSVTTDVVVNFSDAASLSLNDIATQINTDLAAAGFATEFSSHRETDTKYGLQADFGSGETISLAHLPAAESSSVYVTGRSGSGDYADGFLMKVDDLSAADPNEVFYTNITSTYDDAFHGDSANDVAVDSKGNVFVVGTTAGDMEGQINVDGSDIFLHKYDASGSLIYSRMLGSNQSAGGFSVAVDSSDNVVIAGQTGGALTEAAYDSGTDNFISKFDSDGEELWTRQLGPLALDAALDITFDSSGNIYASGITEGRISSDQTYSGGTDAYISKLDTDGTLAFNKQFSGSGNETATGIAVNSSGDIFVAGMADADGYVRKYDSTGTLTYDQSLGTVGTDGDITGIALDSNGDPYISGYTASSTLAASVVNAHSGGTDGFVLSVDDTGASASVNFVTYVGTSDTDKNFGIAVDTTTNNVYVTGSTAGTLTGETQSASLDAHMTKFDSTGALQYTHQFGGGQNHQGFDISFDADGSNTLSKLGLAGGPIAPEDSLTIGARTTVRAAQTFFIGVNGTEKRITIEQDDTFGFLAYKINAALGIQGRASMTDDIDQRVFQIEALGGNEISITKGPGNFNALAGLGLSETRLFGKFEEGDRIGELSADDMAFALGLVGNINLGTVDAANEALTLAQNAMREVKNAHKFITEGPEDEDAFTTKGRASEYTLSRLAFYEGALTAMTSMQIQPLKSTSA